MSTTPPPKPPNPAPLTKPETNRLDYIRACAERGQLGLGVTTRKSDNSRAVLICTLHKTTDPADPAPYHIYPVAELLPIDHETDAYHNPADEPDDVPSQPGDPS